MEELEKKHSELVRILQSFENLERSKEWETLKELVFDRSIQSIERQLLVASQELPIDEAKLYHLQGQLAWAKRYDLIRFIETLKKELEEVNRKIK